MVTSIFASGILVVVMAMLAYGVWRNSILHEAMKEQKRREDLIKNDHKIEFRHDQRLAMMQARVSRKLGKRAYSKKNRYRIEKYLREHPKEK